MKKLWENGRKSLKKQKQVISSELLTKKSVYSYEQFLLEQLEVAKRMADYSTDKNVVSFYLDLQEWIVSQLIKRKSHLNDEIKG